MAAAALWAFLMQNSEGRTRSWLAYWYFFHSFWMHHKIGPFKKKTKVFFSFLWVINPVCWAFQLAKRRLDVEMRRLALRAWVSQPRCNAQTVVLDVCVRVGGCVRACLIRAKSHPSSVTRDIFGSSFIASRLVPALPILCISANWLRKIGH